MQLTLSEHNNYYEIAIAIAFFIGISPPIIILGIILCLVECGIC